MSSTQLQLLFSNKQSPKTVYLVSLLKKFKAKKYLNTKILNIKELILGISELKFKVTKEIIQIIP